MTITMTMTGASSAVEAEERKDEKPRVTVLQLITVPSVSVLLMASLFAAGSLTFLDPLLGDLSHTSSGKTSVSMMLALP